MLNNIEKMNDLIKKITEAELSYYVYDNPIMTDFEYDKLMNELQNMEEQFPQLKIADSPTSRVGGAALDEFTQINHQTKLLSLGNSYNADDLRSFDNRVKKVIEDQVEYVVEHKIDGLTVALRYENGKLVSGATRGNGEIGEDVTENIKTVRSVPLNIDFKNSGTVMEVRGEVFISKAGFKKLNQSQEDKGLQHFANPRNAAAGSLRQLDPKIVSKRPLDIFVFNILNYSGIEKISSHHEGISLLKEKGFKTIEPKKFNDIESVINYCEEMIEARKKLSFDIDGMVVKVNNIAQREILGETVKSPNWAIAYKFPAVEVETEVLDIHVQVGRTGVITPLAEFKPVFVDGSTVAKATLHNQDFIDEKDIRIGDHVFIQKAGDVIPAVVRVNMEKRKEDAVAFKLPINCPVCGADVVKNQDEVAIRCSNDSCPAKLKRGITHFVSKNAMDIDGVGEAVIDTLIEEDYLHEISDLYYLHAHKEELEVLPGFGEKSIDKMLSAVEKSKENDLYKLIAGLGIKNIGAKASKVIGREFGSLENIKNAQAEDFVEIDDIGPTMGESISIYFRNERNLANIEKLIKAGVNTISLDKGVTENIFDGKTFVVTGTLVKFTRKEIKDAIEEFGGKTSSSVSKKTDYVLVGENPGSKAEKASSLGLNIISEDDFEEMLKSK